MIVSCYISARKFTKPMHLISQLVSVHFRFCGWWRPWLSTLLTNCPCLQLALTPKLQLLTEHLQVMNDKEHTHTGTHRHTHTGTHRHTHTGTHRHIRTQVHTCTHTHRYTQTHTYTGTHMYTLHWLATELEGNTLTTLWLLCKPTLLARYGGVVTTLQDYLQVILMPP